MFVCRILDDSRWEDGTQASNPTKEGEVQVSSDMSGKRESALLRSLQARTKMDVTRFWGVGEEMIAE
jgi:hypothetical protein